MPTNDAANTGFFRPPVIHLLSAFVGACLDYLWPVHMLFGPAMRPISIVFFVVGITVFALAKRDFKAAATPIPGNRPTTAIVYTGIFRFSRNPIYISFAAIHLALAFWIGSIWLLASLILSFVVIRYVVVAREEHYLEAKFGAEYRKYQANVRRWV